MPPTVAIELRQRRLPLPLRLRLQAFSTLFLWVCSSCFPPLSFSLRLQPLRKLLFVHAGRSFHIQQKLTYITTEVNPAFADRFVLELRLFLRFLPLQAPGDLQSFGEGTSSRRSSRTSRAAVVKLFAHALISHTTMTEINVRPSVRPLSELRILNHYYNEGAGSERLDS